MAELVIKLADGRTKHHKLAAIPQTIGREQVCDIIIEDPGTSRRHTRISPTASGYLVEDLGSKNGTLVNGSPITSRALRNGDRIKIGTVEMEFLDSQDTSSGSIVIEDEDPLVTRQTRYISRDSQLLLSQRRLQMIYELSGRLSTLRNDRHALLEDAMDICFETLRFERGAIALRQEDQRGLDWPVVRNLRGPEGELTISGSLLRRALENGERAIFTDASGAKADPSVSMVQLGIRSAMCVPLTHDDEILGVIYGDQLSAATSYTQEDIDFLAGIARQVSIGIVNHRLVEEQKHLARLRHDIGLARKIQTELFPARLPDREDLKIAALNDPGNRVSGDYYDVIELEDGRVWLLIADVTGEGVAAALLMANLQAAARVTIGRSDDPGALLTTWNTLVCANTDSSTFITCLIALIDPASRTIRLASAGHLPPLIYSVRDASPVGFHIETGYPLGVIDDTGYTTATIDAGPGPFIFLGYTDGVTEAMNSDGEQFQADRLTKVLVGADLHDPEAVVALLRRTIAEFTTGAAQSDDITLLAARVG